MRKGTAKSPSSETSAPVAPWKRAPTQTARLSVLGPGMNWHRPNSEVNSSEESHSLSTTTVCRAHDMTPPNPDRAILLNPQNSSPWLISCRCCTACSWYML